jgi:hypothetical protein
MNENKIEKEIEQKEPINPFENKSNYLIQIIVDGQVIKQVMALNATVNVIHIGEQSVAADIK